MKKKKWDQNRGLLYAARVLSVLCLSVSVISGYLTWACVREGYYLPDAAEMIYQEEAYNLSYSLMHSYHTQEANSVLEDVIDRNTLRYAIFEEERAFSLEQLGNGEQSRANGGVAIYQAGDGRIQIEVEDGAESVYAQASISVEKTETSAVEETHPEGEETKLAEEETNPEEGETNPAGEETNPTEGALVSTWTKDWAPVNPCIYENRFSIDSSDLGDSRIYRVVLYVDLDPLIHGEGKMAAYWNQLEYYDGILQYQEQELYRMRIAAAGSFAGALLLLLLTMHLQLRSLRLLSEKERVPFRLRLPLELYLSMVGAGLFFCMRFLEGGRNLKNVLAVLGGSYLLLSLLLNWCGRSVLGVIWKNTFCYWLFSKLRGLYRALPLYWRLLLVTAVLGLLALSVSTVRDPSKRWILALALIVALSILMLYLIWQTQKLFRAMKQLTEGIQSISIDMRGMSWSFQEQGVLLQTISGRMNAAVEEHLKSEHLKTELIAKVSSDLQAPLASILEYTDRIAQKETQNPVIQEYTEILMRQSVRLKKLLEALTEASAASAGTIPIAPAAMDWRLLLEQTLQEYEPRLKEKGLELRARLPQEELYVMADGKQLWRVLDNLLGNICKYAMSGTRVYVTQTREEQRAVVIFRNISEQMLEGNPQELLERFVRGDSSRTTTGNGLGLSIATNLMQLQHGGLELEVDGDLFKAVIWLPLVPEKGGKGE